MRGAVAEPALQGRRQVLLRGFPSLWPSPMLIQTFVIRLCPLEHTTRPRQYYFVGRVRMRDHVRNDRDLMLSRVSPVLDDV